MQTITPAVVKKFIESIDKMYFSRYIVVGHLLSARRAYRDIPNASKLSPQELKKKKHRMEKLFDKREFKDFQFTYALDLVLFCFPAYKDGYLVKLIQHGA